MPTRGVRAAAPGLRSTAVAVCERKWPWCHPWGREGWVRAQQLGVRARREIPVTRFKDMEEGERVILQPERTERQPLLEGACGAKRAEVVVGAPRRRCLL